MGREARLRQARKANDSTEYMRVAGDPKPYGSHNAGCPKCGHGIHSRVFCLGTAIMGDPRGEECPYYGQHLHVECARCGAPWIERCKDDPENPPVDGDGYLSIPAAVLCAILDGMGGEELALDVQVVKEYAEHPRAIVGTESDGTLTLKLAAEPVVA